MKRVLDLEYQKKNEIHIWSFYGNCHEILKLFATDLIKIFFCIILSLYLNSGWQLIGKKDICQDLFMSLWLHVWVKKIWDVIIAMNQNDIKHDLIFFSLIPKTERIWIMMSDEDKQSNNHWPTRSLLIAFLNNKLSSVVITKITNLYFSIHHIWVWLYSFVSYHSSSSSIVLDKCTEKKENQGCTLYCSRFTSIYTWNIWRIFYLQRILIRIGIIRRAFFYDEVIIFILWSVNLQRPF